MDQGRLQREPPAVRFQALHSNDCWQFDMSPSDLKHIDKPDWIDPTKGMPTLMLFSVVDDRSGLTIRNIVVFTGGTQSQPLRFFI